MVPTNVSALCWIARLSVRVYCFICLFLLVFFVAAAGNEDTSVETEQKLCRVAAKLGDHFVIGLPLCSLLQKEAALLFIL